MWIKFATIDSGENVESIALNDGAQVVNGFLNTHEYFNHQEFSL